MTSLASTTNHQIRLARRPVGLPVRADWSFTAEPLAAPEPGGVVVKTLLLSLDPAMRGWMNEGKSYIAPVAIDEVMRAGGIGVVVASESAKFAIGDHVSGALGVQEYATFGERQLGRGELVKIDLRVAAPTQWLNVLGMPGMTGYFGLMDVGQPKPGETVVVSGAAGAVGSVVGQLAKLRGARAIGIAGGPEKCSYVVDELGFDGAIDYKNDDVATGLRNHCPDRIDVYFDNVGGEILDTVLVQIARRARIAICGAISQYNATEAVIGPANYLSLLINNATMTGFTVVDYLDRYAAGLTEMAGWYAAGKLTSREDIVDGLETFPETFLKLFSGENNGKLAIRVAAE
jgi:NADPH-dependent curcumin reductase CurA